MASYIIGLTESLPTIESLSGLYLTDLAGVELERLDLLSTEKIDTIEKVFVLVYKRAMLNFLAELSAKLLSNCVEQEADEFLEANATNRILATSLLYRCGFELMIERIESPRLNEYTLFDQFKAQDMAKYFDGESIKFLNKFAKVFFKKKQGIQYKPDLP